MDAAWARRLDRTLTAPAWELQINGAQHAFAEHVGPFRRRQNRAPLHVLRRHAALGLAAADHRRPLGDLGGPAVAVVGVLLRDRRRRPHASRPDQAMSAIEYSSPARYSASPRVDALAPAAAGPSPSWSSALDRIGQQFGRIAGEVRPLAAHRPQRPPSARSATGSPAGWRAQRGSAGRSPAGLVGDVVADDGFARRPSKTASAGRRRTVDFVVDRVIAGEMQTLWLGLILPNSAVCWWPIRKMS